MRDAAARVRHLACCVLGRMLRGGRYATTRIERDDGGLHVRKHRRPYAPALVALGGPLMRLLDTGVRVLPRREWMARERALYRALYDASVRMDGATLLLPYLDGVTLAALLEDPQRDTSQRARAIGLAATALRAFHARGFTHGDAMAENVMVDLERGAARWFDFETVHEDERPMVWRRADDVRALLATCVVRTATDAGPAVTDAAIDAVIDAVLGGYGDGAVLEPLAACFSSAVRRPSVYHLGQAGLTYRRVTEIGALLRARIAG